MDEDAVKVIARAVVDVYEEKTGTPRHTQNLGNFATIFEFMNKAKGFAIAVSLIVGLPSVVASVIVIVKFARGH